MNKNNIVDIIDVDQRHYKIIKEIFAKFLPYKKVLAYGSRVKWNASETSDLDLAVFNATEKEIYAVKEAFDESNIPFIVQILNWETIPQDFKENIEQKYHILQKEDDWGIFKLGEVAEITRGGSPRPIQNYLSNSGTPWVKIADATELNSRYISRTKEYIKIEGESNSKVVFPGDFIVSNSATPGLPRFMKIRACIHDGWLLLRKIKPSKEFLYYLIIKDREYLLNQGNGSIFTNLKTDILKHHKIHLPPLAEQKAIAEILSSLDDKIDLLHRQNKTLENLAETLFRHYFIDNAKDDWDERPLSFFGDIVCGKTPSKKKTEYFNGNVPFIKIPDMHGKIYIINTSDTLTKTGKESQENKTIPPFSICVSCIATVGLVSMNTVESQTNQQINTVIPYKEIYRYYLLLYMKNSFEILQAMGSGGTATLNINTSSFSKMYIEKPDDIILEKFLSEVKPFFDKILSNTKQIQTLEKLRDTLLPKLISGEVKINNNFEKLEKI